MYFAYEFIRSFEISVNHSHCSAKIQIKIAVFVGFTRFTKREKKYRLCGFNPVAMLWSKQIYIVVHSHLFTGHFCVNIHVAGRICKPPLLCVFLRFSVEYCEQFHKN